MTTFVDQVREMGVKQAVIAKSDEVVERITAGMNVNDIRSALRGDEPRRPNPRLRPHADGFWLHIRPSFYHNEITRVYPTFHLGWLSTFMFVWETITGIFLMIFYTPSPLIAYGNMWNILANVPLGQLMRNMHRLGAEVMVIVVALHMLRTFITGSYKKAAPVYLGHWYDFVGADADAQFQRLFTALGSISLLGVDGVPEWC